MSTTDTIQTLSELATRASDKQAAIVAGAVGALSAARTAQQLLEQYRADYALSLQAQLERGLSVTALQNYQMFLARLDLALRQHGTELLSKQAAVDQQRAKWHVLERQRLSYAALVQRHETAAKKLAGKRDQQETDEYASRTGKPS